jgi:two-component system cell cycle response regulator DivK
MGQKRILIAEDSSVIQNLTKRILMAQNYDIIGAKNGKEVLVQIEKQNIDLILLDINMPQMDGMTCAKEIRALADKTKAAVPIIAITGNAKNYSDDDFKAVGINDFLLKPLNYDKLVELVNKYTA